MLRGISDEAADADAICDQAAARGASDVLAMTTSGDLPFGHCLMGVDSLLAGLIGAVVGLLGVAVGAWLQNRKEHQRWLRDQKLRAAIEVIGATGDIYDNRRQAAQAGSGPGDESVYWHRAQDGRSALHLLCDDQTVELAETLISAVRHYEPAPDGSHNDAVLSMLRELVQRLRLELGAGMG